MVNPVSAARGIYIDDVLATFSSPSLNFLKITANPGVVFYLSQQLVGKQQQVSNDVLDRA
jgi:hypothetical protein